MAQRASAATQPDVQQLIAGSAPAPTTQHLGSHEAGQGPVDDALGRPPDLDMLDDLAQLTEWLEMFHVESMVELDYGAVADKV